jgi:hypothetical protein
MANRRYIFEHLPPLTLAIGYIASGPLAASIPSPLAIGQKSIKKKVLFIFSVSVQQKMCWSLTMELSSIESRLITVTWKKTVVGLPAIEKN